MTLVEFVKVFAIMSALSFVGLLLITVFGMGFVAFCRFVKGVLAL